MISEPDRERHPDDEKVRSGLNPDTRAIAMELTWRCLRCGYTISREVDPPETCPNCGAPREEFESVIED